MTSIPVMKPWLGQAEADAAAEAVLSGWVAQGPRVAEFERRFAEFVGAAHAIATSSCTTALHLGLVVAGIGPGDEVIVPSLSFIATTNAVLYVGATPVFADVDLTTANLSVATVQPLLSDRTRAVIVVHQGGMPADVAGLKRLVADRNILVFEDSACAAGSRSGGLPVGHGSDLSAWSFHPRKLLTTGEGGMITTESEEWAQSLRRLREHGMNVSAAQRHAAGSRVVLESYLEVGYNYRMTDIQAAVGMVQLGKLPEMVTRRREIVAQYRSALSGIPGLIPVTEAETSQSNFQSFWVRLDQGWPSSRNDLLQVLADRGIQARRGIMAAHLEPAYSEFADLDLPATRALTEDSVILPIFHTMTDDEVAQVVAALAEAAAR
ncbi:MAG TPA: DegT/DnrJ/EryC1/StrS family aminotransferase [Motilibacterales bacterium]|nr:DegT/DnrJ/EryC1/StrS family aminotransferase [Motilibacterales bacterium]